MDEIAGTVDEPVVIQKGTSRVATRHAESFSWESEELLVTHFKNARLVICHAGVGAILDARRYRKPLIVVPRQKLFGEHFDNHQMEIAHVLSAQGTVVIEDLTELNRYISSENLEPPTATDNRRESLIRTIKEIVRSISEGD